MKQGHFILHGTWPCCLYFLGKKSLQGLPPGQMIREGCPQPLENVAHLAGARLRLQSTTGAACYVTCNVIQVHIHFSICYQHGGAKLLLIVPDTGSFDPLNYF